MKPMPGEANIFPKSAHVRAIIDLAEDAIISIDRNQHMILFNRAAERIFGYHAAEVLGHPLDLLLPQRIAALHREEVRNFEKAPEEARRMAERREIYGRRKDGAEFPAEASISKADVDGEWIFTVILRDVTERKLAEKSMRTSLDEKEALLKEIHHRVKNNLQVISSLLGLQSRLIVDAPTRRAFQESQNRVHSMALVHERLYQSESLSEIDSQEYVGELTAHLFISYGVSMSRVKLDLQVDKAPMNMDAAVPCGLVLNELVSNCLKYAFPDGRKGEIRIGLRRSGGRLTQLVVADDGVGLPADATLWSTKSLGLRLVRILADQMGATVEVNSGGGTEVRLNFAKGGEGKTS
ncbi:MAG TPA: histidine kinase dimerization/phosphoacceptor domain -containing protein [Bryobacteraceae bacterium]|jgi:PAS domain S-box-containing protein|nr:histidine kinase dimerization/phosphoacceptor domain -containing protein [Bryobacteraceae bacterium]